MFRDASGQSARTVGSVVGACSIGGTVCPLFVVGLAVAAVAICTPSIKGREDRAIQFWWLIGAIVAGLTALLPMISAGRARLAEKDAVTAAEKDAVERKYVRAHWRSWI